MTDHKKAVQMLAEVLPGLCESISIMIAAASEDEVDLADGILLAQRHITNRSKAYFKEKQAKEKIGWTG